MKGTVDMIAIGTDAHKASVTVEAVDGVTGERRGCETVVVSGEGFCRLLGWARRLDDERVWALEDCRHVTGRLERFLVARGERVVRVAPKLTAGARRSARERGKSDAIDARAVALAALREGIDLLPVAQLSGTDLDLRLLVDHHDDLVAFRTQSQSRLRWHLHDLYEDLALPTGALDRACWLDRVGRRLARGEQSVRTQIARELVTMIRTQTRQIRQLERQITRLVDHAYPALVAEVGCGPLTAAKLVGEIADATRFATDAKLARHAGIAPIPASSGRRDRYRLDRGGNRQLNLAFHRLAVNRGRYDPTTKAYLAHKQAQGMNRMEALRCLKRHLVRHIHHLLTNPKPTLT
jgi:transposase